jgi:hypothetical protein
VKTAFLCFSQQGKLKTPHLFCGKIDVKNVLQKVEEKTLFPVICHLFPFYCLSRFGRFSA